MTAVEENEDGQAAAHGVRGVSPDVVVVGNVGIDTNVFLAAEPDFGAEGHFSTNLDCVGQAGGYSSRGFARLGRRTAFLGHVGADPMGDWVRSELRGDDIDLSGLGVDPAGTARSVNLMLPDGSRRNFYDGRGHQEISVDLDRASELLAGVRLAVFHLPAWARWLLPVARKAGAVLACDLQDVRDPDDPYRADFVAAADVLFASAAHHPDPEPMLMQLVRRSRGGLVVCGLGGNGAAVASSAGVSVFAPPLLELPVLDTNGAGDALAVGFLTARVLEGRSVDESVLRGQVAARWTCSQRADSSNLATTERIDDLVAQHRRRCG